MLKLTKTLIDDVIREIEINNDGNLYLGNANCGERVLNYLKDIKTNFDEYMKKDGFYEECYKNLSDLYGTFYSRLRSLKGIVDETRKYQWERIELSPYNIYFIDDPTESFKFEIFYWYPSVILCAKGKEELRDQKVFTDEEIIRAIRMCDNVSRKIRLDAEPIFIVEAYKRDFGQKFYNEKRLCENIEIVRKMEKECYDSKAGRYLENGYEDVTDTLTEGYKGERSLKNFTSKRALLSITRRYGNVNLAEFSSFIFSLNEEEYHDIVAYLIIDYKLHREDLFHDKWMK